MPHRDDIVIRLRLLDERSIDAKLVVEVLDTIEAALYASDRRDVERVAHELRLPLVVKDASLERLRHYRHKRLLIEEARSGSIEFVAVIAGVSLYVVEKTLGEAFSEAVRESRAGRNLRAFFRSQSDQKADFIAESVRRTFGSRKRQVVVRAEQPGPDSPRLIHVETRAEPQRMAERPVGSLAEELQNIAAYS